MHRPSPAARVLVRAALAAAALVAAPAGCSLGNIQHEACTGDFDCAAAFGVGSQCNDGYCSDPGTCETGHDCRTKYGGGACVDGACQLYIPQDDACDIVEPEDLFDRPLVGEGAALVIGAIYARDDQKNQATADSVRLAVREINESTGVANGQSVGLVVCDNGGPGNMAAGDERTELDQHALDYLAGTLGVPYLVGPRTSGDALKIVKRLVEKKYPTVVIGASTTSPELTGVPSRLDPDDPYPLFWRTCPSDALQGQVLATEVVGVDVAITKVSFVYTNDAYGKGLSDVFLDTFGASGTELLPFDASTLGDGTTAAGLASTIAGNGSQGIVIAAVSAQHTVEIITALANAGLGDRKVFLTDGSKDATVLLDAALPAPVKTIIASVQGTAPANARDEATFKQFSASLGAAFPGVDATAYSFLTHAYDAAYLGAFGVVFAAHKTDKYDGRDVAEGIAALLAGDPVDVGAVGWPNGKQTLTDDGQLDLVGISGDLALDPTLGEGPAPIEVWKVNAAGTGFETVP